MYQALKEFSTSVYREVMALPAQIIAIPQRLAEINVEIQNVENALRNTRRMLNGFLRHLPHPSQPFPQLMPTCFF